MIKHDDRHRFMTKPLVLNPKTRSKQDMTKAKFIITAILAVLFGVLLMQNSQVVSLKLLFWEISMSRIIFFPVLVLIGFVVGFVVAKMTGSKDDD
jgi:uncharacterized integral membrane protein